MELDRQAIERKDFSAARRGYDPDEVDRHLREIADGVDELRRQARKPAASTGSVASAAAEQVRAIVEAAEQSAAQIQEKAEQEVRRLTSDAERHARETREEADRHARETREKADADAAEHVRGVEEATRGMLERARSIDSEIDALLADVRKAADGLAQNLRTTAEALADDVRKAGAEITRTVESKAGSLSSDLESIRSGLGDVRDARAGGVPGAAAGAAAAEPEPAEPEFEEIVEEPQPAAVADPAAPEPAVETEADALDYADEQDGYGEEDFPSEVPEEEDLEAGRTKVAEVPPPTPDPGATVAGGEGARLIALNMALNGTPREETAKYLAENFDLADQDAILDDVYSRAGQG